MILKKAREFLKMLQGPILGLSDEQINLWNMLCNGQNTYNQVSDIYNIPHKSIANSLIRTAMRQHWVPHMNGGTDPYLSDIDEEILVNEVTEFYNNKNCARTFEIQKSAYELKMNRYQSAINELFKSGHAILANKVFQTMIEKTESIPDRTWVNIWASRHNVEIKRGQSIDLKRIQSSNPDTIINWFEKHQSIMQRNPKLIFNADETMLNFKKDYKVLIPEHKQIGLVINEDSPIHITSMVCFNSCGDVVKPFFILPNLANLPNELRNLEQHAAFVSSPRGWINFNIWEMWAFHFVCWFSHYRNTLPNELKDQKILLITDGHKTRSNPRVLDLFRSSGIELLILPPHISHILQPFDVGIGGALKVTFRKLVLEYARKHSRELSAMNHLAKLRYLYVLAFLDSLRRTITIQSAANSFKSTGIYPFNPFEIFGNEFIAQNIGNIPQNPRNETCIISGELLTSDNKFIEIINYFSNRAGIAPELFMWQFGNSAVRVLEWQMNHVRNGRYLCGFLSLIVTTIQLSF